MTNWNWIKFGAVFSTGFTPKKPTGFSGYYQGVWTLKWTHCMQCSGNSRHETADQEQRSETSHPSQTDHTLHTYLHTQTHTQTHIHYRWFSPITDRPHFTHIPTHTQTHIPTHTDTYRHNTYTHRHIHIHIQTHTLQVLVAAKFTICYTLLTSTHSEEKINNVSNHHKVSE